jgi:hypothetical protein
VTYVTAWNFILNLINSNVGSAGWVIPSCICRFTQRKPVAATSWLGNAVTCNIKNLASLGKDCESKIVNTYRTPLLLLLRQVAVPPKIRVERRLENGINEMMIPIQALVRAACLQFELVLILEGQVKRKPIAQRESLDLTSSNAYSNAFWSMV